MTYAQLQQYIDDWIYQNANEEITALILNDVLKQMADFGNEEHISLQNLIASVQSSIGVLNDLNTTDKTNLVNAINEVLSSIQVFTKIVETPLGINILGRLTANSLVGRTTVDGNVSGLFSIDLNDLSEQYILTLVGNSNISFSNMIQNTQSVVISLSVTGNFALTLPSWLKAMPSNDDYDGTINNEIVINIKQGGATPIGYYSLTNIG